MPLRQTSLLIALATLLLTACGTLSVFSLAYNNAPTAITWRANDYFDFEAPQKAAFSERIEKLMVWHRREQLPDYARLLRSVLDKSQGKVTETEIAWMVREVQRRYRLLGARLAEEAGDLALQLNADNLKALDARVQKSNDEFARDFINAPPERVRKKRAERIIENVETWVGTLTEAQKAALTEDAALLPQNYALVFEERKRRQQALRAILQSAVDKGAGKEEIARRLTAWATNWEAGRSPAYLEFNAKYQPQSHRLFANFVNTITPEQRAFATKKVNGYIEEMTVLAGRG